MPAHDVTELVLRWDRQQAAYIAAREERFTTVLDVLAVHFAEIASGRAHGDSGVAPVVVDAACGPGSLAQRVLARFPDVRVIGVDYDPALLAIATASLAGYGDRFIPVDADLASPHWVAELPVRAVSAVVSSTALHWLSPAELAGLYTTLGDLIEPNGLLLNADHLRFAAADRPFLARLAELDDLREQASGHAAGAQTWDAWWDEAKHHPVCLPHLDERARRFADRGPTPDASVAFHCAALTSAGFRETGTVWQRYDDFIVLARR